MKKDKAGCFTFYFFIFMMVAVFFGVKGCSTSSSSSSSGTYIKPTITRSGKFRKGHIRKSQSTDPNAIRNRMRSKQYYQKKGKFTRKKKSKE